MKMSLSVLVVICSLATSATAVEQVAFLGRGPRAIPVRSYTLMADDAPAAGADAVEPLPLTVEGTEVGGCCDRQPSCCDGLWKGYCAHKRPWCLKERFGLHCKPKCAPPAPKCCPAPRKWFKPAATCCPPAPQCCPPTFGCLKAGFSRLRAACCPPKPACCPKKLCFAGLFSRLRFHGKSCDTCNECGSVQTPDEGRIEEEMPPVEAPALETGTEEAAPEPLPPPVEEKSAVRWLLPPRFNLLPTVTYSTGS